MSKECPYNKWHRKQKERENRNASVLKMDESEYIFKALEQITYTMNEWKSNFPLFLSFSDFYVSYFVLTISVNYKTM